VYRAGTFERGGCDRVGVGGGFDVHRSAGAAVVGVGGTMPILDAPVDVQHRFVIAGFASTRDSFAKRRPSYPRMTHAANRTGRGPDTSGRHRAIGLSVRPTVMAR
jgi:hypothetical protein